jgi:hypothetical protein
MNDIVHDLLVYFDVGDSNNHDGDATTADSSKNVRSNELYHRRRRAVAAAAVTRSTLYIIMKDLLHYVCNIMIGVVPCTLYGTSSCTIGNLSYGLGLLLWALLICNSIGIIVSIITGFFGFLTETFPKKNNGHVVDADDDDDDSEVGEEWIPPLHQQQHALINRAAAVPPSQPASILRLARVNNGTNNNNNNNSSTNRKRKSSSTVTTTRSNINVAPFTTTATTIKKKKRSKAERHREAIRYAKECQRLGLLGP